MKNRNKNFCLGILVMVLVFGMMVFGCKEDDQDDSGFTITITGITHTSVEYKYVGITVGNSLYTTASAKGKVQTLEGNSVTFSLFDFQKSNVINNDYVPWKEKGDFIIQLHFYNVSNSSNEVYYLYTNGKTWVELGLNNNPTREQITEKLPKYTISSSKSTIDFSKFQVQSSGIK
jgi:hypothetical protein